MLTYFPGPRLPSRFPDSDRHSPCLARGFCGQIPGNSPVLAPAGEMSPPVLLQPRSRLSFLLCSPLPALTGLLQALLSQMPSSSWSLRCPVWLLFSNHLAGFKCVSSYPKDTYDVLPFLKINHTICLCQGWYRPRGVSYGHQGHSHHCFSCAAYCSLVLTCLLKACVLKASLWGYQE